MHAMKQPRLKIKEIPQYDMNESEILLVNEYSRHRWAKAAEFHHMRVLNIKAHRSSRLDSGCQSLRKSKMENCIS